MSLYIYIYYSVTYLLTASTVLEGSVVSTGGFTDPLFLSLSFSIGPLSTNKNSFLIVYYNIILLRLYRKNYIKKKTIMPD